MTQNSLRVDCSRFGGRNNQDEAGTHSPPRLQRIEIGVFNFLQGLWRKVINIFYFREQETQVEPPTDVESQVPQELEAFVATDDPEIPQEPDQLPSYYPHELEGSTIVQSSTSSK